MRRSGTWWSATGAWWQWSTVTAGRVTHLLWGDRAEPSVLAGATARIKVDEAPYTAAATPSGTEKKRLAMSPPDSRSAKRIKSGRASEATSSAQVTIGPQSLRFRIGELVHVMGLDDTVSQHVEAGHFFLSNTAVDTQYIITICCSALAIIFLLVYLLVQLSVLCILSFLSRQIICAVTDMTEFIMQNPKEVLRRLRSGHMASQTFLDISVLFVDICNFMLWYTE
eukprot:m51a1_g1438 hypothetical protein (225) ;mRNA; f:115069-118946